MTFIKVSSISSSVIRFLLVNDIRLLSFFRRFSVSFCALATKWRVPRYAKFPYRKTTPPVYVINTI
jgi:hypothetical protein